LLDSFFKIKNISTPKGEHKGKMEMAFFTIGAAVTAGGLFGGVNSLFRSIKETQGLPSKIKYTQLVAKY
jgi:hypothetical protein